MATVLFYTTCGGDNIDYTDMTCEMIKSVRKHINCDFAIICKKEWFPIIKNKLPFSIIYFESECSDSPASASANKLKIFDYDISKYSHLFYIDSDIMLTNNLSSIFSKLNENESDMYVFEEPSNLTDWAWCSKVYSEDEIEFMEKNKLHNFNAGQFIVVNNLKVKETFAKAYESYLNNPSFSLYEQGHINTTCKFTLKLDYEILKDEVLLFANDVNQSLYKKYSILHFCGCGYPFEVKLKNMKTSQIE